jgi:hypothetical protein
MGKKSSPKGHSPAPPASKGINPLIIGAVLVALVGVGVLAFWRSPEPASPTAPASTAADQALKPPVADAKAIARAEAVAKLGPRKQANLPPIPFRGYAPPRSREVVTAAYQFAAEHPEILSYVPCFCGCENAGHGANTDCFVKARAENGDVVEWDEHGVECAVCIDVANRSRQMHASGASVRDIRAAIDKEFGSPNAGRMGTPHPPQKGH